METKAVTFPAYPNVRMTEEEKTNLGPIASEFFKLSF